MQTTTTTQGERRSNEQKKQETLDNLQEYENYRADVVYFASKYAYIEDSNNQRIVKWQAWQYLVNILDDLSTYKVYVVAKAKQAGVTWDILIFIVWLATFGNNAKALLYSATEDPGAYELISKCKFILDHLPSHLQRKVAHSSKSLIQFAGNNSKIEALASTKSAGVGYNATIVFRDELDLHEYPEANLLVAVPTIDSGGWIIEVSTRDKEKPVDASHFVQRYLRARDGLLGEDAKGIFLGWRERPIREEGLTLDEFYQKRLLPRYSPSDLEILYPSTEDDFLAEAETTRFFDQEGINFIRRDCYAPITTDYDGIVKVWEYPVGGRKYASFLDPSNGSDPHAAGWMDVLTKRLVCVSHGNVKAEKCAEIFDKYNRIYNSFNEFELTGPAGLKVGQYLDDLNTPNRRVSKVGKGRKNKYGWWTTAKLKSLMLDGLEEAVRNRRLRIHYKEIPNELEYMIKRRGEVPAVPSSKHDDLIIMLGGLLQIMRETQAGSYYVPKPGKCVGFG